jgi:hypothetical protein
MKNPQKVVGWFLRPTQTAQDISAFGINPVTFRHRQTGETVTIVSLFAAGEPGLYQRTQQCLASAAKRIRAGRLDAAFYAVPFRIKGWSRWEVVLRILMKVYDLRLRQRNKLRRRKAMPETVVPEKITPVDVIGDLRRDRPKDFRRILDCGRHKILSYIWNPEQAFEADLILLWKQGHAELDEKTLILIARLHLANIDAVFEQKQGASVALFVPLEIALHVATLLHEQGFRPVLLEVREA